MKVYIITEGSYDAYHMIAVASTPENAELYKQAYEADEIEVWEVDPELDQVQAGRLFYRVVLSRNGRRLSAYLERPDLAAGYWLFTGSHIPILHVRCFAETKAEAVEIAQAVREKLMDTGQWPEERTTCDQGIHPLV